MGNTTSSSQQRRRTLSHSANRRSSLAASQHARTLRPEMADHGLSSDASSTPTPAPAPQGTATRKKPMFKKPDWLANRQAPANEKKEVKPENKREAEAVDIFSRSNDTHATILAERAEKERRAKEKNEEKE